MWRAVLILVLVLTLGGPLGAGTAGAQVVPTVHVPDTVHAGDTVVVEGSDHPSFCAQAGVSAIVVVIADVEVALVTSLEGGTFSAPIRVPPLPPGPAEARTLCRVDTGQGAAPFDAGLAQTSVEVVEAEATVPAEPTPVESPPTTTVGNGQRARTDVTTRVLGDVEVAAPAAGSASAVQLTPGTGSVDPGAPDTVAPDTSERSPTPTSAPAAGAPAAHAGAVFTEWVNDGLDLTSLPLALVATVLLTMLFAVLIGFPSALFDTTLRSNYDEFADRLWSFVPAAAAMRPRIRALPDRPALAGFALLGAGVSLLVDPAAGLDLETLWPTLGLALALGALGWVGWFPAKHFADRRTLPGRWRAYPFAVVVVLGCVAVTRGLGIDPGYLYGLLFAYHVAHGLDASDDALTYVHGFVAVLFASCVSWVAWVLVGPTGTGALEVVVATAMTTFIVGGVQGTLFALLPFRGTPGGRVRAEHPVAWRNVTLATVLAFAVMLVDVDDPLFTLPAPRAFVISLLGFLAFAAVSLGAWWRFTLRRLDAEADLARAEVPTGGAARPG